MKLPLLTLAFFIIGPAAESKGLGFVCAQSSCSKLPVDGCPVESVPPGPGETWSCTPSDFRCGLFLWEDPKLFVPSQERWAVKESLNQPSPGVYLGIFGVSDKKGSK